MVATISASKTKRGAMKLAGVTTMPNTQPVYLARDTAPDAHGVLPGELGRPELAVKFDGVTGELIATLDDDEAIKRAHAILAGKAEPPYELLSDKPSTYAVHGHVGTLTRPATRLRYANWGPFQRFKVWPPSTGIQPVRERIPYWPHWCEWIPLEGHRLVRLAWGSSAKLSLEGTLPRRGDKPFRFGVRYGRPMEVAHLFLFAWEEPWPRPR